MLPSGRKAVDCSINAQGEEGHSTGCVKFRPPVFDYQGSLENQQKLSKKTLLSVSCNGIINHWDVHKGGLQHSMKPEN